MIKRIVIELLVVVLLIAFYAFAVVGYIVFGAYDD